MFVRSYVDYKNMVSTQNQKTQFRSESSGSFGVYCLIRWTFYGPHEGSRNFRVADVPFECMMCNVFLGLQTFVRNLLRNIVRSCFRSLTSHTKNQPFIWSSDATEAFESLTQVFTMIPHVNRSSLKLMHPILHQEVSYHKLEMTDNYTLLPFIHKSLKLQRSTMRSMTKNFLQSWIIFSISLYTMIIRT